MWIDAPGLSRNLADKCEADAEDLGAWVSEKRRLLRVLCDHGRGKCSTAQTLRTQIADLLEQQKQWNEGAARLRGGPLVCIKGRSRRAAMSTPPREW